MKTKDKQTNKIVNDLQWSQDSSDSDIHPWSVNRIQFQLEIDERFLTL